MFLRHEIMANGIKFIVRVMILLKVNAINTNGKGLNLGLGSSFERYGAKRPSL